MARMSRSRRRGPFASLALLFAVVIQLTCGGDNNVTEPEPTPTEEFVLTVVVAGDGAGTVTSTPAGISCTVATSPCTARFAQGTSVTLAAAASGAGAPVTASVMDRSALSANPPKLISSAAASGGFPTQRLACTKLTASSAPEMPTP